MVSSGDFLFEGGISVQKLKRSVNIGFRVTEEEQAMIRNRMGKVGIRNLRTYLLKMAVNGYVINLDLADVRECSRLLRIISNNVNQLAKRANEGGNIYAADIADVQIRLGGIWERQDKIIRELSKILEVA
jgi:hypothetical protein